MVSSTLPTFTRKISHHCRQAWENYGRLVVAVMSVCWISLSLGLDDRSLKMVLTAFKISLIRCGMKSKFHTFICSVSSSEAWELHQASPACQVSCFSQDPHFMCFTSKNCRNLCSQAPVVPSPALPALLKTIHLEHSNMTFCGVVKYHH